MTEWSKVLVSNPTLVMLHYYKLTVLLAGKQFENNKQHTFSHTDCIARIAEWSNAPVSGTSHFDRVASNFTPVMLHCYKLTVLLAYNQFENNKQQQFQVPVISMTWVPIAGLSRYTVTN